MTVTKLTLSPTLLASRLAMSGVFMAAIGMSAGAQAASPYVELYQNNNVSSGNTDAATNTANTAPSVPAARITQTRRITARPSSTAATQSPNNSNSNDNMNRGVITSADTPMLSVTPVVHVIQPNYIDANTAPATSAVNLLSNPLPQIPTPQLSVSNISYVPTVMIPLTQSGNSRQLNVSLLDDFINEISPHARHYPPNFDNASQRYYGKIKLKELESWLRPYADAPDASFEVLLRASKLNGMARNLDSGSDYAVRAGNYIAKAISRQPDSAEANFLYGMMLSEGGGFKEGKKYLDKAASLGYLEAEQS